MSLEPQHFFKKVLVFIVNIKLIDVVNKKGKFRILSYLIDNNLIYYKSINKEKKLLAFSLFELSGYYPIDKILQEFLKQGLILFYSFQINILKPEEIMYFLCIRHENKGNIFKIFNSIMYKLNQIDHSIHFFKDQELENKYLKILTLDNHKNSLISDSIGSIRVKHNSTLKTLNFYIINNSKVSEVSDIIPQFINYLGNIKRNGYLIFNFLLINDKISSEIYYVEFIEDLSIQIPDLELDVNNFFGSDLISKINLEIKKLFIPLWRYRLKNNHSSFQDSSKIHNLEYFYDYKVLLNFNQKFRELLEVSALEFHQFSRNLFFVEQSTLIVILATIKFKFLLNLIKKYRSKFFLLVIILNDKGYDNLMEMKNLNTIPNLKILNYEEFCQFDLKSIKTIEKLKNP